MSTMARGDRHVALLGGSAGIGLAAARCCCDPALESRLGGEALCA
jgi:hypothetical protein